MCGVKLGAPPERVSTLSFESFLGWPKHKKILEIAFHWHYVALLSGFLSLSLCHLNMEEAVKCSHGL